MRLITLGVLLYVFVGVMLFIIPDIDLMYKLVAFLLYTLICSLLLNLIILSIAYKEAKRKSKENLVFSMKKFRRRLKK